MFICPGLFFSGIHHYWTYLFVIFRGLRQIAENVFAAKKKSCRAVAEPQRQSGALHAHVSTQMEVALSRYVFGLPAVLGLDSYPVVFCPSREISRKGLFLLVLRKLHLLFPELLANRAHEIPGGRPWTHLYIKHARRGYPIHRGRFAEVGPMRPFKFKKE